MGGEDSERPKRRPAPAAMPKYDMEEKLAEFHTQGYVVFEGYAPTFCTLGSGGLSSVRKAARELLSAAVLVPAGCSRSRRWTPSCQSSCGSTAMSTPASSR